MFLNFNYILANPVLNLLFNKYVVTAISSYLFEVGVWIVVKYLVVKHVALFALNSFACYFLTEITFRNVLAIFS
jgi:hypothetical protein